MSTTINPQKSKLSGQIGNLIVQSPFLRNSVGVTEVFFEKKR